MRNVFEYLSICELCQAPLKVIHYSKDDWHAVCTHCGALHQGSFR